MDPQSQESDRSSTGLLTGSIRLPFHGLLPGCSFRPAQFRHEDMMNWSSEPRWICQECRHITTESHILIAPSPFAAELPICGCPSCKEVNSLKRACDVVDCRAMADFGTPADEQDRWTCHEHIPRKDGRIAP